MNLMPERNRVIQAARRVAATVDRDECTLAGACVVSSVAAGDFTQASDVDMLMVAVEGEGAPGTRRTLLEERVFEWVVVPKSYFVDIDRILLDPGETHDVLTAAILFDKDGWIQKAQKEVERRYREPQGIWERAAGQLQRIGDAIEDMQRHVEMGRTLLAQRAHVSMLKGLFGLPRALLNKRCTMTRGLVFCREATAELGWSEYSPILLEVFSGRSLDVHALQVLYDLGARIVAGSGFSDTEKAIRIRHLLGAQWLLENATPIDAAWPLYFWSSTTVEEAGGRSNPAVWEHWQRFADILRVGTAQELGRKIELARQLLDLAAELAETHRARLALHPDSP